MKKLLIYIAVFSVILTSTYANGNIIDKYRDWVLEFYNFGFVGNDCSKILYDYEIQGRTFTSESSQFIRNFYNACQIGKEDAATGQNSFPMVLDDWDSNNGGE